MMSCGEVQIQMVGEHLLHRAPIGLVTFYLCPPTSYWSGLMPFWMMAKMTLRYNLSTCNGGLTQQRSAV
jgi:hypothetical protein